MADDPYKTLGVERSASEAEIRSAYRKLAKKHHPDLNPGNKQAEERFKAISAAHELLSDAEKRARFDRGEIDASGQERPEQAFYRSYAEGQQGRRYAGAGAGGFGNGFSEDELGDIINEMFRGGARGRAGGAGAGAGVRMRGQDMRYALTVDFVDAVNGATKRLSLPDGRGLDVRVPPGIESGQTLRLKGQGGPGANGGPAGDALIEVEVAPHPYFRREGNDVRVELPVSLTEAVLGARVEVPTPSGRVAMNVPKHSDAGTRLRLRGKGVAAHGGQPAGDLYVELRPVIGPADAALEEFLRGWKPGEAFDPRKAMEGS
jgi:DnaJ-class molecular chaperone